MMQQYMAQYYDGSRMMDGGGWGWGILMMLVMIIITFMIVNLIIRSTHSHSAVYQNHNDAIQIAKKRYAKGEVTKEEFERIRKDLE